VGNLEALHTAVTAMSSRCSGSREGRALASALAFACASVPALSGAANLEPAGINLGFTSFYDGFGRNEEGFTYLAYAQYQRSRNITGDDGNPSIYFVNPKIDAYVVVNQLVYVLPEKLFGDTAHLGIDFIVPVIGFDTKFNPPPPIPSAQLNDNGIGLGDLTFGPLLQFRPVIAGGRPVFSHRFELDFIVPTGKYDPDKDINQSSHYVSINPYWAGSVLPLPHLEISTRLHYLYNFSTDRPPLGRLYSYEVPTPIKSAQAGQAVWLNFAASYELPAHFHWGVNGFYFHQLNKDLWEMRDGSTNDGSALYNDYGKASVFGIGPGAMFDLGQHDKLFANVYFEPLVYNRPQSTVFNLHWIHGF
jgi:hypothetical protein